MMHDPAPYSMGERAYVAAIAAESGCVLGQAALPRCAHPGCQTPDIATPCEYAACPRKGGSDA
jgi:hypothetical protein